MRRKEKCRHLPWWWHLLFEKRVLWRDGNSTTWPPVIQGRKRSMPFSDRLDSFLSLLLFKKLSELQVNYQNSFAGIEMFVRNTWNSWNEINDPRLIFRCSKDASWVDDQVQCSFESFAFVASRFYWRFVPGSRQVTQPVGWCAITEQKELRWQRFSCLFLYMRSMTLEIPALPCWSTQTDWLEISQRLKERDNLKCWCKRRLSEIKNYDVRVAKFPVFLFALVTISCTTCSQLFRFIAALFFDISSLFSNWDVCSDFWSLSGQFASQITFVLATDDIILPWIHNVFF